MRQIGTGDFQFTKTMRQNISKVINSNRLSYGPMSREFEQKWATLHGCDYGVLSNSGTSSLLVALQTLKEINHWQNGDEVLVPSITFVATINIVLQCGLRPVLVDVDPDTYNIDHELIEAALTSKTRCCIPVHLFGKASQVESIKRTLKRLCPRNIPIIVDSCEAVLHPAQHVDITVYSFYNAHHVACGIGGMAVTDNPHYAAKMRSLVNHGLATQELSRSMEIEKYDPVVLSRKFEFDSIGHSFRITEIESAIALAQLPTLKHNIEKRRDNAQYLLDKLRDLDRQELIKLPQNDANHSWMMFPILMLTESSDGIRSHLTKNNIGTRTMMPLTNQPCYAGLWKPSNYPIADYINTRGFYVGCHQYLGPNDLNEIIKSINDYFLGRWL